MKLEPEKTGIKMNHMAYLLICFGSVAYPLQCGFHKEGEEYDRFLQKSIMKIENDIVFLGRFILILPDLSGCCFVYCPY